MLFRSLFVALGATDEQLDFPVIYASGREGYAALSLTDERKDLSPLLDLVVERADQPLVNSGWLLVLSGDPALFVPRQVKEPVLYVGAQTAQRVNFPQESGKLVVIVPGDFRLEDAPIFFGAEALPEELRQSQIDAEFEAARAAGARPPTAAAIEKAMSAPWQKFASDYELRQRAIDLVAQYSPQEKALIDGARVPLAPAFRVAPAGK